MASGIHHIIGDVEPVPFHPEPDGKPFIELHTDVDSPFSPMTTTTDSAISPLSPLEGELHAATVRENGIPSIPKVSVSGASSFKLGTASIDDVRPMRIVIIGAGFSGITAGIRFPQRLQNIDFTIYDKNAGYGGTWLTNKYPGLACDIPSHCYQLTFEENIRWSAFYAPGPEIRAYLEHVVDKFKLKRYIKLQHEIVHAHFDEVSGKWHLRIRRPMSDAPPGSIQYETFDDTADFVFAGLGALSRWSWPDIPGLNDFKGKLLHSADWETDEKGHWQEGVKDWGDKKIGVIGVGSSGLQIVPALQLRVKHLYNYVRGKTWLAPPFASHKLLELMKRDPNAENYEFSDEDRKSFEDPVLYKQFRHDLESELNSVHFATIRGSEMQKGARIAFKDSMIKRLAKKPWIADHLIPDFSVACRRLTPGPGYLEALCEDNVDFVPTHIKRITETGIELVDGSHHNLDVLICATGYDTSFQYPFSIVGRGGKTLNERFSPHPVTYLTVCTDGFPNWFMSLGPNSGVGSGSLLVLIERQIDFAVAAAMKLQREHLKTIEPKAGAVADFDEYLEHYFQTTVYSEKCRSWYKMGKEEGRIVGLWPGSCLHAVRALTFPRWEDFNYKPLDEPEARNRFYWLGDGSTYNEKYMVGDRAWYLNPEEVDIPPVPQ